VRSLSGDAAALRFKPERRMADPKRMAWDSAEPVAADAVSSRTERLAVHLYPHRLALIAAGLGCFLLGALPLVGVARGTIAPAEWHVAVFATSVPFVLWAHGLAILATFLHPRRGLVRALETGRTDEAPRGGSLLRVYAKLTVWAFALAPLAVLVVCAV
jgi:hypothetical protein